jgi:type II secretory pathway component PulF
MNDKISSSTYETIGWSLSSIAAVLASLCVICFTNVMNRFVPVYNALGEELPTLTKTFLYFGNWATIAAPIALFVIAVFVTLKTKDNKIKIILPFICCVFQLWLIKSTFIAVYAPIAMMQTAVRGA